MDLPTGAWGDAAVGILKPREETAPDADGVRTVTTWRHAADGGVEKVVQRVKSVERTTRVCKAVEARKNIPKFGLAAVGTGENVTYVAADEVHIEKPDQEQGPVLAAAQGPIVVCRTCGRTGHWTLACPFKETMAAGGDLPPEDAGPGTMSGSGMSSGMGISVGGSGSYVPPHLKHGGASSSMGGGADDDSKRTLKVTNLTRDADRDDLRELFQAFGSIERINVVRERDTGESRGMAFVCFFHREDAAKALAKLDGHPYAYQILSVEWAKPRTERPGARSLSEMRVTGYGGALPNK